MAEKVQEWMRSSATERGQLHREREDGRGSKTQIDLMSEREKWSEAGRKCHACEFIGMMEKINE